MSMSVSARSAGSTVTRSLEASARAKIQGACNFVNGEIDRVRNQTIGISFAATAAVLFLWSLTGLGDGRVPLVLAAGVTAFCFARARSEVASSVRTVAAKRIVAGLGLGLAYKPASALTMRQFTDTDLFSGPWTRWTSKDEISAIAGGAKYSLHRVRAGNGDRKGPIFEGVVIKIDFAEAFPAHTIIIPDDDGQHHITSSVGRSGRRKDLVMMKNPAFERLFSVYSTDYYEARKVVTPFLMQLIVEARARLDAELRLCFLNRSLYLTVAGNSPKFTQKLFAVPLTPEAAVGTLAHLVPLARRLAELYD